MLGTIFPLVTPRLDLGVHAVGLSAALSAQAEHSVRILAWIAGSSPVMTME